MTNEDVYQDVAAVRDDQAAEIQAAPPVPLMAGTIAAYGSPDGGAVLVIAITEGTLHEPTTRRVKVPGGVIRALMAALETGSKPAMVRAMLQALASVRSAR